MIHYSLSRQPPQNTLLRTHHLPIDVHRPIPLREPQRIHNAPRHTVHIPPPIRCPTLCSTLCICIFEPAIGDDVHMVKDVHVVCYHAQTREWAGGEGVCGEEAVVRRVQVAVRGWREESFPSPTTTFTTSTTSTTTTTSSRCSGCMTSMRSEPDERRVRDSGAVRVVPVREGL